MTRFTTAEFLSLKSGKFEDYEKAIDKRNRLKSKLVRASNAYYDAEDSLSCFDEKDTSERAAYIRAKFQRKSQLRNKAQSEYVAQELIVRSYQHREGI
jgi:hypothetical protein